MPERTMINISDRLMTSVQTSPTATHRKFCEFKAGVCDSGEVVH